MTGRKRDSILLPATNGIINFVRHTIYSALRNLDRALGEFTGQLPPLRAGYARKLSRAGLAVLMDLTVSQPLAGDSPRSIWRGRLPALLLVILVCSLAGTNDVRSGPVPAAAWTAGPGVRTAPASPCYRVTSYVVHGGPPLSSNALAALFAPYTGTNVSVAQLVSAATELHREFVRQGEPGMSVAVPLQQIGDGIVTLNAFATAVPQVLVSGQTYIKFTTPPEITLPAMAASPTATNAVTETALAAPAAQYDLTTPAVPLAPATPEEIAKARSELLRKMAEQAAAAADTRVHVTDTNAGPHFPVEHYLIVGNTLLPPATIARTMTNIDGDFGTNVSFQGIHTAVTELQKAYTERGYVTVSVGLPQQKLTNETVKIQVTEGRLVSIEVRGNHYFSSNNVMRSLPSLHTNMILNAKIFQAELNRANANQDRQIYPVLAPGPYPGSSALQLKVKDRLPLHAKVEFNNQNTPGTPDLRLNTSLVYNNLWDQDHSLGLQYGFSPELYKNGSQWNYYDKPLVANYGGFYRLPLGPPPAIEQVVENNPGTFGYDEATRKFNLPPPSGQPELNFFASRSTLDTGVTSDSSTALSSGTSLLLQSNSHQDLTVNNDLGFRLSSPLQAVGDFTSDFSAGLDFKTLQTTSTQTVNTTQVTTNYNAAGQPVPPPNYNHSPPLVTGSDDSIQYLPVTAVYNAKWQDGLSSFAFGLGVTVNPWYTTTTSNLAVITLSKKSTGYWATVNPNFSWQFPDFADWMATLSADGQWASEPLNSNEKYGAGGVASVRGYHEGEVMGDEGWHVTVQQDSPVHTVGLAFDNTPLTVRGSAYMDYARVYSLDPAAEGTAPGTSLWDFGVGGVLSLGSHWEARFLCSLPLLATPYTPAWEPYFNFDLTAQF